MAKKTEKYIKLRKTAAGSEYYQITIRKYDQSFSKNINVKDFDSKKQALAFAVKLRDEKLVEMQRGFTVSNFKTVQQLFDKSFDIKPVSIKTKKKHLIFFNAAIAPYGDIEINKITAADIQKSLNEYAKNQTKEQVQRLLSVWRRIYDTAAMLDINIPDRTKAVTIPLHCKAENKRETTIDWHEFDIFIDTLLTYNVASKIGDYYAHSVYYGCMIMAYAGLRPAEVFALTVDDIDLIAGKITVNKAVRSTETEINQIGNTKTPQSVRSVDIPDNLRPILIECLNRPRKTDFLMTDIRGNLMDIDKVCTYIRNVRKKAGVSFVMYDLRHQFSTDLFSNGTPPNIVRDLMGHKGAAMSLDYANSSEEDRKDAILNRKFS